MRIFSLFLLLLLFSCKKKVVVHPANITISKEFMNLKGPVKRIEARVYNVSGSVDSVVVGSLDSLETLKDKYPIEFDSLGLITLSHAYSFKEDKSEVMHYSYDDKNRIREIRGYVEDSLVLLKQSTYEADSAVTTVLTDGADDTLLSIRHAYVIYGDTIASRYYREGKPSGESFHLINGKVLHESGDYTYEGVHMLFDIKRNYKKRKLYKSTFINEIMGAKQTIRSLFNENEDMISRVSDEDSTYRQTWTYKYDNQNNWIEKASFTNGSAKSLVKRVIEYY